MADNLTFNILQIEGNEASADLDAVCLPVADDTGEAISISATITGEIYFSCFALGEEDNPMKDASWSDNPNFCEETVN
jgi:hypothetical protein